MSKYDEGNELVKLLSTNKIKSSPINNVQIEGTSALFNRYALFSYRGKDTIDYEADALSALLSTPKESNKDDNPTAKEIVNYYKDNDFNSVEYDYLDFLYLKKYGKIPNNYLLTLRRFPFAVEDNIFNKNITPNPDIARVVTYFGEGTGTTLADVLRFTVGYNWKTLKAEIQALNSQKMGNPIGGMKYGKGKTLDIGGAINTLQRAANPNSTIQRDANKLLTGSDFSDPLTTDGFYHNKILGPVNVIDQMNIRERGLKYNQNITIVAEYELKSFGGLNPKKAMLDILANLLTVGFSNAPFWGGAIRYLNDNRTNHVLGEQKLLLSGDYGGYLKSVGTDLQSTFSSIFSGGGEDFSFQSVIGGLMNIGKGSLSSFLTNKLSKSGAVPNYQVANALLTGQATGEWHLTVGNPLNPICTIGNLILDDMSIAFDEMLGSDDFPVGIKATFKLKPARPRDKTDIENMFNLGQGRLYFMPEKGKDILNIAGNEKYHYGVVNGVRNPNDDKDIQHRKKQTLHTNNVNGSDNTTLNRFSNHTLSQIQNSLNFHSVGEVIQNK